MALLEQARPRYSDRALRASAGLPPRSPLLAAPSSPTIFRPEHGEAYILPAAPTHEPEDEPLPGQMLGTPGLGAIFGAEADHTLAEPGAADEGDEEVLEELRDENEELVSPDVLLVSAVRRAAPRASGPLTLSDSPTLAARSLPCTLPPSSRLSLSWTP